MAWLPEWSERIDERGMPIDPLSSNRSRNRVTNLFAHGLITSITLRLRYVSIFCWALDQFDDDADDTYAQLKNVEKLFCLASRYRQLQADQDDVIQGMDGNTRFNYDDEEFDEVVLDDLKLLKNDGYAYSQFYEGLLQKLLLKRGETDLTVAGAELAAIVDGHIGAEGERVLRCARDGRAERADFEAFARSLATASSVAMISSIWSVCAATNSSTSSAGTAPREVGSTRASFSSMRSHHPQPLSGTA